jgi:hypothetical protein
MDRGEASWCEADSVDWCETDSVGWREADECGKDWREADLEAVIQPENSDERRS